jgi:hypothetical protein
MRTKSIIIPGSSLNTRELTRYYSRQQRYEAFLSLRHHFYRCDTCKPWVQCEEFQRLYGIMTASQLEATTRATAEHQAMLAATGEFTNQHLQEIMERVD